MTNAEIMALIHKAQITTGLGGLAAPQKAEEFILLAKEQNGILKTIRVVTGIQTSYEVNSIELGEPALHGATEGVAPASGDIVAPTITPKVLQPVKAIAAFDITFDMIRENLEGDKINETLNNLFAIRWGKDTVLAIFSGDNSIVGTTRMDKAKKIIDGFIQQAEDDADVHDYTIPASPTYSGKTGVFNSMLKLLPKDYRDDRAALSFFCSQDVVDDYLDEIGEKATPLGDSVTLHGDELPYKKIKLRSVYGQDTGRIVLTPNANLIAGFGDEMTVGKDIDNRAGLVKVTIRGQMDAKFAVGDALVLGATA